MNTTHERAYSSHPLAAVLARSGASIGTLAADWFPATDLIHGELIALEAALERQMIRHPAMDARTKAAFFIGEYNWYVPAAAIAAYLTAQRVPDLSPENLALRLTTYTWHYEGQSGEAERIDIRFLSGRFAVLPDDPTANHPDAVILPDADTLRNWLRTALEAHLTPMIERIYTLTRLSRYAQWCLVADSCATLFLNLGQGDPRSQAEGLAFIKTPGSPMNNSHTSYINLQYLEHSETFCARGGCCRNYTLPGGEKCTTCVLHPSEERNHLLLQYMTKKYTQADSAT